MSESADRLSSVADRCQDKAAAWSQRLAARRRRPAPRGRARPRPPLSLAALARSHPEPHFSFSRPPSSPAASAEPPPFRPSPHHRAAPSPTPHLATARNRRRIVLRPDSLNPFAVTLSQGKGPLAVSIAAAISGTSPERELVVAGTPQSVMCHDHEFTSIPIVGRT